MKLLDELGDSLDPVITDIAISGGLGSELGSGRM
jgi:hypothetical protein